MRARVDNDVAAVAFSSPVIILSGGYIFNLRGKISGDYFSDGNIGAEIWLALIGVIIAYAPIGIATWPAAPAGNRACGRSLLAELRNLVCVKA